MPRGVPKSGRVIRQSKLETLRRNAEKLRAKLAELEAQTAAHDAERHRLIGRIILAHAEQNTSFAQELRSVLAGAGLSKDERTLLGLPATADRRNKSAPVARQLSSEEPDRGADMA
jgi:hypothetical protein